MAKTIAAYGGGFKPPTAGHFEVVSRALSKLPNIDEFIIYVGGGERDGITQAEAVLIWEIYQTYLPMKVKIEPSKTPIGDVVRLGKNNPQDTVYFVIGGREGREDDTKDIESRTKGIEDKYPNMKIKIIQTPDQGMSGTNARKAAKVSYEDFIKYLPTELSDEEKEEVYNIVKPMVNEALIPSTSEIKAKFKDLIAKVKQQGGDAKKALIILVKAAKGEVNLTDDDKAFIKLQLKDALKAVLGNAIFTLPAGSLVLILLKAIKLHGLVVPTAFLNERLEPYEFKTLFVENENNTTRYTFTTNQGTEYLVDLVNYPKTEVMVEYGAIKDGKKSWIDPTNDGEPFKIISTVTEIIKEYYVSNPNLEVVKWEATKGKNNTKADSQRDKLNIKFFQREVPGIKVVHEGQETRIILPKLNENASYSSDIDYKEHIKELTKYMIEDGWNILPLPKVVFKHGDSENARNFFGKTAYYDPNTKTIVLYTEGRHPKDIVRSFSHEMVHHEQNLDGRLGDIYTTNTQEDDRLNDIEKEANLNGTMTFRNWTDSLNESLTKNSNHIYHWTSYSACKKIIESNKLKSNKSNQFFEYDESRDLPDYKNVVFFTVENERFADEETSNQCILVVDKSKLSKDYKVISYGDPYEETVVYTNDSSIPILPYLKGVILMNTLQKSAVKKMVEFLESKGIPYEINDKLEREVKAKKAKLPSLKKELINKLKLKYPNGFIGYLNAPLYPYQTLEYFKDNPTYSYPNITINKPGEYEKKNKFQVKFKIEPQNLEKYINWFMYDPDSIEDLINMDNYEGEDLWLKGDIPIDLTTLQEKKKKDPFGLNQYARELAQGLEESLNEGRYDSISRQLASIALNSWKSDFKDGASYGYFMGEITPEEYPTDLTFTFKALGRFVDGPYKHNGYSRSDGEVGVKYEIPKDSIPQIWEEVYMDLISTIRHEIEHQTQGGKNVKPGKGMASDQELRKLIQKGGSDLVAYVTLPKEIESNVQGLYLKAKKWRRPYNEVADEYIKDFLKITNPADVNYVKAKWQEVAKKRSLPNLLNEGAYDSIVSKLAKDVTDTWVMQFKEDPKRLFALLDTSYEFEDAKGRPLDFTFLAKLDFKKTKDRTYKVDGGANEGDDETEGFVELSFQVDPRELPRMWSTIAMDIRDVLRHEIEHLTQGGWNVLSGKQMEDDQMIRDLIQKYKIMAPKNYFLLDKEVDAMLQGMYFKAKKARRPFAEVIEDYLDMVGLDPEEKEEIKTRWRGRVKALSLPLFEELEEIEYKIYSDMDGVLTDFDASFMKASDGIRPSEYERNMGKYTRTLGDGKKIKETIFYKPKIKSINEVGEGTGKAYPLTKLPPSDEWEVVYAFTTDQGTPYYINFESLHGPIDEMKEIVVGFKVKGKPFDEVMNKGELFSVMATVLKAAKKFQKEYPHITKFAFTPVKSKDNDTRREKLYSRYVEKQYPGWDVSTNDPDYPNFTVVSKPEKEMNEEQETPQYEIYSDMDGVITDFESRFESISGGVTTKEYEKKHGKDGLWELIDKHGVGWWVGMPWMPDGKQYWDYIKEYNPILLSSPSRSSTSRLGKRLWVRNNLPGTKLILTQSKDKQNYARKNRILIDDRPSNIEEWRSQGGIGILHTSASNTIRQLKELGL